MLRCNFHLNFHSQLMANSPKIWMPLCIGDYLKDTARLTTEQSGAYLHLIMDYWVSGPPPDDPVILARICKLSGKAWRINGPVLREYFTVTGGHWTHDRIDAEILLANKNKSSRKTKAAQAAAARWSDKVSD